MSYFYIRECESECSGCDACKTCTYIYIMVKLNFSVLFVAGYYGILNLPFHTTIVTELAHDPPVVKGNHCL